MFLLMIVAAQAGASAPLLVEKNAARVELCRKLYGPTNLQIGLWKERFRALGDNEKLIRDARRANPRLGSRERILEVCDGYVQGRVDQRSDPTGR
ncbi:MAG TPA: hypothetical protein VIA98_06920 [Allosphingosinicella sp.]|jgi:hypothetical protein